MCNEEERQLLMLFEHKNIPKGAYDLYPNGKNSPPDAQARVGNNLISIEHTRLTKEPLRRDLSLRCRIMDECKRQCDWKKYSVHILLKPGTLYDRNITSLAQEIAEIVGSCHSTLGRDRLRIEGSSFIIFIRLSGEFERNPWQFIENTIGWVAKKNDLLVTRINAKEKRLSEYCSEYNENWLLICFDRYRAHGFFELDFEEPIKTSFNKIYVISEDSVGEIRCM